MLLAAADYIDIVSKKYIGAFYSVEEGIWIGNKNHNIDSCREKDVRIIGNTKIVGEDDTTGNTYRGNNIIGNVD